MDNNVSFQLMEIRTTFTACHDASRECKSKIKEGEVYNNTFLESLRPEKLFALFSKDNRSTRIELYRVSIQQEHVSLVLYMTQKNKYRRRN